MVALRLASGVAPPPGLDALTVSSAAPPSPPPGLDRPSSAKTKEIADLALLNVRLAQENAELRQICEARRRAKDATLKVDAAVFVPGAVSFDSAEIKRWNCGAVFSKWMEDASTISPVTTQPPSDDGEDSCDEMVVILTDSEDDCSNASSHKNPITTIMLRNVPMSFTTTTLLDVLETEGFLEECDFCYLPAEFESGASMGYAFVNAISDTAAQRFVKHFSGFQFATSGNDVEKTSGRCEVEPTSGTQGRQANIERYRNSPVMHVSIADEFKPTLLEHGKVVPFPAPTKTIKPPRRRSGRQ